MKKLLGIVVLGLLMSSNAYANQQFKVELKNCGKMSSSGGYRAANVYFIDATNKSTASYKITHVAFYTKNNERMSLRPQHEILGSFQRTNLMITQPKMIHSMLDKVVIMCEEF